MSQPANIIAGSPGNWVWEGESIVLSPIQENPPGVWYPEGPEGDPLFECCLAENGSPLLVKRETTFLPTRRNVEALWQWGRAWCIYYSPTAEPPQVAQGQTQRLLYYGFHIPFPMIEKYAQDHDNIRYVPNPAMLDKLISAGVYKLRFREVIAWEGTWAVTMGSNKSPLSSREHRKAAIAYIKKIFSLNDAKPMWYTVLDHATNVACRLLGSLQLLSSCSMAAYPLVSRTADSSKHLGSSIGQAEVKDPNLAIDSDDSQETVGASTHTAATPKSANSKRVRSKPSSRKAAQEIPWRKQLGPIKKERLPESWFNIQEHSSKTPLLHFGVRIPGVDDYLERLHRRLRPDLNKNDVELVHAVYLAATLKLIKLLKEKSLPSPEMPVIAMTPHKFDFFVSLYNNMRVYRFFRATIDEHIPEYLQCIKEAWLLNDDELEQPMWYHDAINCDEDALPTDEERKAFVADFPKDLYTDPDQPTSSKATLAGGAATSATQAP